MIESFVAEHKFKLCSFLSSSIPFVEQDFSRPNLLSRLYAIGKYWCVIHLELVQFTLVCNMQFLHLLLRLFLCLPYCFRFRSTRISLFSYFLLVRRISWESWFDTIVGNHWLGSPELPGYLVLLTLSTSRAFLVSNAMGIFCQESCGALDMIASCNRRPVFDHDMLAVFFHKICGVCLSTFLLCYFLFVA